MPGNKKRDAENGEDEEGNIPGDLICRTIQEPAKVAILATKANVIAMPASKGRPLRASKSGRQQIRGFCVIAAAEIESEIVGKVGCRRGCDTNGCHGVVRHAGGVVSIDKAADVRRSIVHMHEQVCGFGKDVVTPNTPYLHRTWQ